MIVAAGAFGPEQIYLETLRAGEFRIQFCANCRRHVFYPRILCPHCGESSLEWVTPSGRGSVYSTTVVRRKAEAGGDYNVCLVDLHEGQRMMTRIDGVAPERVCIGMRVVARVVHEDGAPMVVFVPDGSTDE